MSQNHFKSLLAIAVFVLGFYYEFEDYLKDLHLEEHVENYLKFDEDTLLNLFITNALFILAIVLFSLLFSVIVTFVINYNLEVVENQKTIEINKGLFNKVSLSLTPSRIQNLVVKTNRVKQYFGLHSLSVKQAMVNIKQQKNFNIVALEYGQLNYLLNKLLPNYNKEIGDILKPRPYFMRIYTIEMGLIILAFNALAVFLFGTGLLWVNTILIPFGALYVYFAYKKSIL